MTDKEKIGKQRRAGCIVLLIVGVICIGLGVSHCEQQQPKEERVLIESGADVLETAAPKHETAAPPETILFTTEPVTTEPVTTEPPTTEPPATEPPDEDWQLLLVNSSHAIPDDFEIDLVELSNGVSVDSRIYPALQEMFDDMRSEGIEPIVREGFRTHDDQQDIMDERREEYINEGYDEDEADALAREYVAEPGTSEHELGLAVDINAGEDTDSWTLYDWLAEHAHEYGFILRYPEDKSLITGISYEPWHYRYVGTDAAEEIYERGITLEEYLGEY